jgi:transcriptional regulator with XRE-family HTH domain
MPLSRPEAFGKAVRQARKARGLTQEDASLAVGMDRAYLGHIERATQNTTMETAWRIADMLGMKLSELVAQTEELVDSDR